MRPCVRSRNGSRMACCKWPMIGLYQSMNQMAPSGPILTSDGRKFGSVEERIGSTSVPAKLASWSATLYCRMPWKPMTLATSRLPWFSFGKRRLDRISTPGQGRVRCW